MYLPQYAAHTLGTCIWHIHVTMHCSHTITPAKETRSWVRHTGNTTSALHDCTCIVNIDYGHNKKIGSN